jgi:histidinol-phosphate aminotransferase
METAFPAAELFKELLQRSVIVRPMQGYGLPNHIRISFGKPEEMDAFWKAAAPLLDGGC